MRLDNINKILFITLSNIGDVILTLPVLSALRLNFPNAEFDVVVGVRPKEIFTKDPRVNEIFIYDKHARLKDKVSFIRGLRGKKYDLAIDMRRSLIPILIGAKNRTKLFSINRKGVRHKRWVHLDKIPLTLTLSPKGRGNNLDLLSPLGRGKGEGGLYIDNKDREKMQRLLEENGVKKDDILIGISPSCRSLLKQWRIKGFIDVINNLLKEENRKIVLIGDESQVKRAEEITNAIRHKNLLDFTGRVNLNELFALIERMYVLLTCDSAAMHIASECGIKVVAIFGPTDPKEYGPISENDIVVRKDIKCVPCNKAVCRFNHECMREIDAGEVLDAVEKALQVFR